MVSESDLLVKFLGGLYLKKGKGIGLDKKILQPSGVGRKILYQWITSSLVCEN